MRHGISITSLESGSIPSWPFKYVWGPTHSSCLLLFFCILWSFLTSFFKALNCAWCVLCPGGGSEHRRNSATLLGHAWRDSTIHWHFATVLSQSSHALIQRGSSSFLPSSSFVSSIIVAYFSVAFGLLTLSTSNNKTKDDVKREGVFEACHYPLGRYIPPVNPHHSVLGADLSNLQLIYVCVCVCLYVYRLWNAIPSQRVEGPGRRAMCAQRCDQDVLPLCAQQVWTSLQTASHWARQEHYGSLPSVCIWSNSEFVELLQQ